MENKKPRGEIGVLRDVFLSRIEPHAQLFLIVEHEDEEYIGCVMFDDGTFCGQVCTLLKQHCGKTVVEIGNLDLGHLFQPGRYLSLDRIEDVSGSYPS